MIDAHAYFENKKRSFLQEVTVEGGKSVIFLGDLWLNSCFPTLAKVGQVEN